LEHRKSKTISYLLQEAQFSHNNPTKMGFKPLQELDTTHKVLILIWLRNTSNFWLSILINQVGIQAEIKVTNSRPIHLFKTKVVSCRIFVKPL